jgi:hypothetical protein
MAAVAGADIAYVADVGDQAEMLEGSTAALPWLRPQRSVVNRAWHSVAKMERPLDFSQSPASSHEAVTLRAIEPVLRNRFARFKLAAVARRTPEEKAREIGFWRRLRGPAAAWLIERLSEPQSITTSWAVSDMLAAMAPDSVGPIVETLEGRPAEAQADALLSAVGGLDPDAVGKDASRLLNVIRRYMRHADDMIRVRAVGATNALDEEQAIALLRDALTKEADPAVRTEMEDMIEERSPV